MGSMVRVGAARLSAGGDDHESGLLEDVEDVARLYVEEAARVRRLVWLQGLGLSYREMAGETGMTRRTVERQLMRARSSLADAGA